MPRSLETAVNSALRDVPLAARDKGTAELARVYARQVDAGEDIEKLGPLLLKCLEALLMTPQSRAAVVKGRSDEAKPASPLDELKARRARRGAGAG